MSVASILRNKVLLAILAVIGIAGGLLARIYLTKNSMWLDAIGPFFDALFIAGFLGLVVDPRLKHDLVREATKDVFGFIFGYSFPSELRDFLNSVVLQTKLVRRDCRLEWKITPKAGSQEKISVHLHASFVVENFTNEALNYKHEVAAWSDSPEEVGSVESIYCKDQDRAMYGKQKKDLKVDSDGYIRGEEINVMPRSLVKREGFRFGAHYYSESTHHGLDQFGISETTINVLVKVVVDETLKDLSFLIIPVPTDPIHQLPKIPTFDAASGNYQCEWSLTKVFVPNEMILIRWGADNSAER